MMTTEFDPEKIRAQQERAKEILASWEAKELEELEFSCRHENANVIPLNQKTAEQPASPVWLPKEWVWKDPTKIPPRDFVYGTHYIRKFVSAGFGPPAGGKSSKRLVEAVAMASGRALLGVKPVQRLKVWYWNGEDPEQELDRRIAAICLQYNIKREDLKGYLFVNSGRDDKIIIATQTRTGAMIMEPMVERLTAGIKHLGIDVVILDPMVSTHRVPENDNPAIDAVVKQFADIADHTDCAIDLEHHIRKTNGNEATVDDGRGASSLVGAARSIEVLNKMTKVEGGRMGLDNHWRYFSVDDGKANMSPLAERGWFKIVSVDLGNETELHPKGDNVGVVVKWTPPEALEGITGHDFEAAVLEIGTDKWRGDVRAKNWIGKPIAKALKRNLDDDKERAKVGRIVGAWLKSGSLEEYEDTVDGHKKTFVRVARDEG
jgi:hypothetical protein